MENKSFYELISNHVIEIPIIQREYAQGRNLPRVISIRNRFVKDLANCIRTNQEMHLGFVYGKVEGKNKQQRQQLNRDAVSSILEAVKSYANNLELKITASLEEENSSKEPHSQLKFIPLDGQQRLTTLYLLHWYLSLKGAKSSNLNWLHHFNYTNRKSTMDFLKEINSSRNIDVIKKRISENSTIKDVITESSFYLQKWNKDKTVLGMLEMLKAIEKEFEVDFEFSKISLESIGFRFDFMDLDALNQTNELYVKMNSRGKQLTNYEHFKSWLQEQHKTTNYDKWLSDFWRNLDNDWLNFFWRKIDADFSKLDDFFFNFLKNIALMHNIATHPNIPFESFKGLIGLIRNSNSYDSKKISYIPFEKFYVTWNDKDGDNTKLVEKKIFLFNKKTLEFIKDTFETLQRIETNTQSLNYFEDLFCKTFLKNDLTSFYLGKSDFTPTQPDAVFYYAFIGILNKYKDQTNENIDIRDWLRFNRNLIYNTSIQSPLTFYSALQQVGYLLNNLVGFVSKAINNQLENSFFDNNQFEEEVLKLKTIETNSLWYTPITKAENQYYFQGQIKFLFDFSLDDKNEFNLLAFTKYSNSCSMLFGDEIRRSDKNVLQRALLCKGDYLPHYKSNHLFPQGSAGGLRTRNENWRLFFKSGHVGKLKNLVDSLDDNDITEERLDNYIQTHLENHEYSEWDWKYLFLKYPESISYCKSGFIKWNTESDIRLLSKTNVGGYHTELRSYCFYLENRDLQKSIKESPSSLSPFKEFYFFVAKNSDGYPGCYLSKYYYKRKEYRLDLRYSRTANKFDVYFYHNEQIEGRKANNTVADVVLKHDYKFDDSLNHYHKSIGYTNAFNEISTLCKELNNIGNE